MLAKSVAVCGHSDALLLIEQLREGEIFQFIETRVLDQVTFEGWDDAASGFNVTPKSATVDLVKINIRCGEICPEPAGLLVC